MLRNEYFRWLCDLVCKNKYGRGVSYRKLLRQLHDTEFTYLIPMDQNRAINGTSLRWRFACEECDEEYRENVLEELDGPCSVLEMMIALAIECEVAIMDDPAVGDRTGQWFWDMIVNLGLGSMTDYHYDISHVRFVIRRFLDREYEPNGRGGLFTIEDCPHDLRDVEIWNQLTWYLGSIMYL